MLLPARRRALGGAGLAGLEFQLLGLFALTLIFLVILFIGSKSDDVDENEIELPENMSGL